MFNNNKTSMIAMIFIMTTVLVLAIATIVLMRENSTLKEELVQAYRSEVEYFKPQAYYDFTNDIMVYDLSDNDWGHDGSYMQMFKVTNFREFALYTDLYMRDVLGIEPKDVLYSNQQYMEILQEVSTGRAIYPDGIVYVMWDDIILRNMLYYMFVKD